MKFSSTFYLPENKSVPLQWRMNNRMIIMLWSLRVIIPTYRNGSVSGKVTSCNLVHLEKCIGLLPRWCNGKESACNAGDTEDAGLIPELGRLPAVGNGNPLEYSCLENSGDRETWWATVRRVANSWKWLGDGALALTQTCLDLVTDVLPKGILIQRRLCYLLHSIQLVKTDLNVGPFNFIISVIYWWVFSLDLLCWYLQ